MVNILIVDDDAKKIQEIKRVLEPKITDNINLIVAAQNFCQNFSKLLAKLFGKYFRYL